MIQPIPLFNGQDQSGIEAAQSAILEALTSGADQLTDTTEFECPDLIGVDSEVYRQINSALRAGYKNLMFYGPPGTGKTTLAQRVAGMVSEEWKLITGSSDWTSQDIIGGYQPVSGGGLRFQAGMLLEHFDKPLVFDELNRCDIDKVIGPLFTVLSGHSTTLAYLSDPEDAASPRIEITPAGGSDPPIRYSPGNDWMFLATINSVDKASLYQMSYALTRRFAWIYVDVPRDKQQFIRQYLAKKNRIDVEDISEESSPLGEIWDEVCRHRAVGPAPIIDIIKTITGSKEDFQFFGQIGSDSSNRYLDGFFMFLMPMLDGILREQADQLAERIGELLGDAFTADLRSRLLAVSV